MRRRPRPEDETGTPLRLRRYNAEDWGGGPDAPARWYAALQQWREDGNGDPEVDWDTDWPDVPFDPESI